MIISKLGSNGGFFSELFFMVNHYIHCKKHNRTFRLDTNDWLYKFQEGWTDYFNPIDFDGNDTHDETHTMGHIYLFEHFPLYEYITVLKDIFIFNKKTRQIIDETIRDYFLLSKQIKEDIQKYDAIYIRRGDKLFFETNYISGEKYLELLMQKNPNCQNVYLQTDDYNSFLEIQKYISEKSLNIHLFTRCDPNMRGIVNYRFLLETDVNYFRTSNESREYYKTIQSELKNSKAIESMTPQEKYEHTIDFLTGVEIVLGAEHCVMDKQSNVSRFIWIFNKTPEKVYDVKNPEENLNLNKTECPGFW